MRPALRKRPAPPARAAETTASSLAVPSLLVSTCRQKPVPR